jgi:predicted acetyltransferase
MNPKENLSLIEPADCLADEFQAFVLEFSSEDDIHGLGSMSKRAFADGVKACADHARGLNLPEGNVPGSTLWLVKDGHTVIGTIQLRHRLNAFLLHEGGHIGYSIRPSQRRKGYATKMLAMALVKARELGLTRVLITCDKNNPASAGVIKANSGALENEVVSTRDGGIVQRYWVDL